MLEVPVQEAGTEPPCFRCLFDKPISEGWCQPETCEMLDAWLMDNDFSWVKYAGAWILKLEFQNNMKSESLSDEFESNSNFL